MKNEVGGILGRIYPKVSSIRKFKKGSINETYEFKVDNKYSIIRIYPKDFWKIKKEEYLYGLIRKKTDVPVPKVLSSGRNYLLMSKIQGRELSIKNKNLVEKAGELLAKIHSIKFPCYGWIIKDNIKPKFQKWVDFIDYDTDLKLRKIPAEFNKLKCRIKEIITKNKDLLDVESIPCLLHKDYHSSHIIVDKGKINGIIDLEWAISGHNEFDIAKSCLWMFDKDPVLERIFLRGYKQYGQISIDFDKRKRLYKLLHLVSSLSFSYECRNKKWCIYNLKELEDAVNEYNKAG